MSAGNELTPIDRARELVLERVVAGEAEAVPLADALGRILAAPVTAVDDVPGFDNSAMDGYAVRAADTAGAGESSPRELAIVGESRAGHPADRELGPGEAMGISTGAMVPAGADAVVRVEDTSRAGDRVSINAEVGAGRSIRRAGEDIRSGVTVIEAGARIGAAELGVLASVGIAEAELRAASARLGPAHRRRAGRAGHAARPGSDPRLERLLGPAAGARRRSRGRGCRDRSAMTAPRPSPRSRAPSRPTSP